MRSFLRSALVELLVRQAARALPADPPRAARRLDRALRLQPDDPRLLALRGEARGVREGAEDHRRALAIAPERAEVHLARARALLREVEQGAGPTVVSAEARRARLEELLVCCGSVLALDPGDVSARFLRARGLAALDRLPEALSDLRTVVADRPDDPDRLERLAEVEARLGRYRDALATLERVAAREPDRPRALALGAICRLRTGDPAGARADATAALARKPDEPLARRVLSAVEDADADGLAESYPAPAEGGAVDEPS